MNDPNPSSDVPAAATLTVDEAAALLGISRNSAYEAVRRNEIPSIRIGRRVLIPRGRFMRWLAEPTEGEARGPNP